MTIKKWLILSMAIVAGNAGPLNAQVGLDRLITFLDDDDASIQSTVFARIFSATENGEFSEAENAQLADTLLALVNDPRRVVRIWSAFNLVTLGKQHPPLVQRAISAFRESARLDVQGVILRSVPELSDRAAGLDFLTEVVTEEDIDDGILAEAVRSFLEMGESGQTRLLSLERRGSFKSQKVLRVMRTLKESGLIRGGGK